MAMNGQHINREITVKENPSAPPQSVHSTEHGGWSQSMTLWISVIILCLLLLVGGRWFVMEYDETPILTYEDMKKPLDRSVYFFPEMAKPGV